MHASRGVTDLLVFAPALYSRASNLKQMSKTRREFVKTSALVGATAAINVRSSLSAAQPQSSELDENTLTDVAAGLRSGRFTCRSLAEQYLARIDALDKNGPKLNSVIELNPDALSIADSLNAELKSKGARGPLHGVPVLIKDNIATRDRMQTTAGSLALVGSVPPQNAFVVQQLRKAGAVILGKTNLSEWANIRSAHSTSGWSGRGGLTKNPYALDRNTSGSSSGSGAACAANLCAVAVGTETDGSVISPSSMQCLVGIKPTVGLVSRNGIIPIAHSQDTAGPMCRSVADAAALLTAMTGVDPADDATSAQRGHTADYTRSLDPRGLRGARLGVVRKYFGFNDAVDRLIEDAIAVLKHEGAEIIDPADIPTIGKWDDAELLVLLYELKADLNKYLAELGPSAPVKSLRDVIAFNDQHRAEEMPYFGQDQFIKAEAKGPLTTKEYVDALAANHRLTRKEGIDFVMDKFKLDALVAPSDSPAWLTDLVDGDHQIANVTSAAAVAGYPHITVPAGFVHGLPVGISFFGRAWSEAALIKFAYAFEQAAKSRKPPRFLPSAELQS